MTEYHDSSTVPANKTILHGTLTKVRARGGFKTTTTARNELGGTTLEFAVQAVSPYGEPFTLPITTAPNTRGVELLKAMQEGDPIAVVGSVHVTRMFDDRFAEGIDDNGREIREMRLRVTAILEHDTEAASAVWLRGTIAEAPRLLRHPDYPDMQFAITELDIIDYTPSAIPGSRALILERSRVRVAIPVDHPSAERLYRAGNVVIVEGVIDAFEEAQRGMLIADAVDDLRQRYDNQRAAISPEVVAQQIDVYTTAYAVWQQEETERRRRHGASGNTQPYVQSRPPRRPARSVDEAARYLRNDMRRDHNRVARSMQVYVQAGYVELLSGSAQTLADARVERDALMRQRRERRQRREQQVANAQRNAARRAERGDATPDRQVHASPPTPQPAAHAIPHGMEAVPDNQGDDIAARALQTVAPAAAPEIAPRVRRAPRTAALPEPARPVDASDAVNASDASDASLLRASAADVTSDADALPAIDALALAVVRVVD